MSCIRSAGVVILAVLGAASTARAQQRSSEEAAAFLHRLAGEWSVVAEAVPGPGQDPIRTESREVARVLGGRWLVAESTGQDDRPSISILTLGYDPSEGHFVGTWISGRQTHLWSYVGALDESGTMLTLETEGPILGDAAKTTKYREIIEIEDADQKVVRSLILGPDGEWFEFARAEYRRSRPPVEKEEVER